MVAAVDAEDDRLICPQAAILAGVSVGRRYLPANCNPALRDSVFEHLGTPGKGCGTSNVIDALERRESK
jgi:hypothetical protein